MTSLRARAVTGGILWAFVIITLGLAGMTQYVTSQTQARFVEVLEKRHSQAVVALVNNPDRPTALYSTIDDELYTALFSGNYWQVESEDGVVLASQSLGAGRLPRAETAEQGEIRSDKSHLGRNIRIASFPGPRGQELLAAQQWIELDNGEFWHVQVATSLGNLDEDVATFRSTLITAIAVISLVGVLGALAQVAIVLQPLNKLRQDVSTRWENEDGLAVAEYPIEVHPFVTDINTLLERNREIMRRSRRQAADLAHAIKTPSAIMRNELMALEMDGADVGDAIEALDRLDAQLKRSFARMRADGTKGTMGVYTDLDTALGRMNRAFQALARNQNKTFTTNIEPGLRVRMDQSDFEEIIGNILDNALKYCEYETVLNAWQRDKSSVEIILSDDGPGIPQEDLESATESGRRLDTSKPGTGLGLAIAQDLVVAYGGGLTLSKDPDLGGLMVQIHLLPAGKTKSSP